MAATLATGVFSISSQVGLKKLPSFYSQVMRIHLPCLGLRSVKSSGCPFSDQRRNSSCFMKTNFSMPSGSPVKQETQLTTTTTSTGILGTESYKCGHPHYTSRSLICTSCTHQVSLSNSVSSEKSNDSYGDEKGQSPKSKSPANGDSDRELPEVFLKQVPESSIHWEYQQDKSQAKCYDLKPIKVKCVEGKMYMWCTCGNSRLQPLCDGSHRRPQTNTKLVPVPWTCKKTGYYWFCNCKQTNNRPFCDGSHLKVPDGVTPIVKI